MRNDEIRFPMTIGQRTRNIMGPGYVPCQVSGRWLQFETTSAKIYGGKEDCVGLHVMTKREEDSPERKLCEVFILRSDLERALRALGWTESSVASPDK